MKWNEVRIFISSTFNDMHAERDYLITEVFPELNDWCERRRIRLTDIDLRWGVTKEDSESGNTIRACLKCIDECRPFFLCFLGQRRGWVPDLNSGIDEKTFEEYKGLREKIGTYSITEMEIEHAALAPMYYAAEKYDAAALKKYALFFFRQDPFGFMTLNDAQKKVYTNVASDNKKQQDEKLAAFKERVRREQQVYPYTCRWNRWIITEELRDQPEICRGRPTEFKYKGKPLKNVIIAELQKRIAAEYPENTEMESTDRYDEDAAEQQLYAQVSAFDFVGREEELRLLKENSEKPDMDQALYVYAPEGTGKSALLGRFVQECENAGKKVLFRSCAITDKSSNENDLYLSLGNEAGLFRASQEENQSRYSCLDAQFFGRLMEKGYDTLILDGIDRLSDLRENISLPSRNIPAGFHLIISSDEEESAGLFRFPYTSFELQGLTEQEQKEHLIRQYLLRTLKKLDAQQTEMILSSAGSQSPLYLRIVLNELKNYGSFSMLEEKISAFGDDAGTAFMETLRGIEKEYEDDLELFRTMTVLTALARDGLSEEELLRGLARYGFAKSDTVMRVRILKRRIKPYLNHSNGRDGIHIRSFAGAILSRYSDLIEAGRRTLAGVYKENFKKHGRQIRNQWTEVHGCRELLYQLEMLKDFKAIEECLDDDLIFEHIHPREYFSRYIHGSFIAHDPNMTVWDPADRSSGICYRTMAELFARKARKSLRLIYEKYPHPHAPKCAKLRQMEDQEPFLEYRDLFYETTQLIKGAAAFEALALYAPQNEQEKAAFKREFDRFTKTSDFSEMESFMDYLSRFGARETGLSHQIEDMADDLSVIVNRTRRSLGI